MTTNALTDRAARGKRGGLQRDTRSIEEQIRRLARLYERGLKSDEEFESELRALRAQQTNIEVTAVDQTITITESYRIVQRSSRSAYQATLDEQRALLLEIFDKVYLKPHQAMAIRPAAAYTDILKALDESSACNQRFVQWAGWGSNPRPSV